MGEGGHSLGLEGADLRVEDCPQMRAPWRPKVVRSWGTRAAVSLSCSRTEKVGTSFHAPHLLYLSSV
jgi:hypothetical protein